MAGRFKVLWVTNNLDGSEDFLVSQKLMNLVGPEMIKYRNELMAKEAPLNLNQLMKEITPPKGVRRKSDTNIPRDEGVELFDCEGDCMEGNEEGDDGVEDEDGEERENSHVADTQITVQEEVPLPNNELSDNNGTNVDKLSVRFPYLRNDLVFLNELRNLLEVNGPSTSRLFTSYIVQLKTICQKARLSLKKRMRKDEATGAEDENEVVEQEAQDERIYNTSCIEDEVVPIMFVTDAETFPYI